MAAFVITTKTKCKDIDEINTLHLNGMVFQTARRKYQEAFSNNRFA